MAKQRRQGQARTDRRARQDKTEAAEIEKKEENNVSNPANFINAGTARCASTALQIDGTMRAAGRPSFLKAKDSGHVAAARTLAQDVDRRTTGA